MKKIFFKLQQYGLLMRINRPIGIYLLLWPTLWALWIAGKGQPDFFLVLIFVGGVVLMRSAGCIINDIIDRRIDAHVRRTSGRPLVVGTVTIREALLLFTVLCSFALFIALQLNAFAFKLSFIALFLTMLYPWMKRYIYLPQLILGMAFAWSVPMAFAAQTNHINPIAWLLYGIAVCWPLAYDSIYALMDKEDDLKIAVKSSAILFGQYDNLIISFMLHVLLLFCQREWIVLSRPIIQ